MRALFGRICELTKGEQFQGDPAVSYMDLPKLCVLDQGKVIVTFSNYFYDKKMPLYVHDNFTTQCLKYNDSLEAIKLHDTIFGWPECMRVDKSIQSLPHPGLLYFGWGSHVAEVGDEDTFRIFRQKLMNEEYFKRVPTIWALIEDVDSAMIPDKFGPQYIYRNNERIHAVNKKILQMIEEMWDRWPIDVVNRNGRRIKGFYPVMDVFSPSHAGSEVLHGDAVHFWSEFEIEITKWLTHWITHAPQVSKENRFQKDLLPGEKVFG